jgi:hypothetical protein
VDAGRGRRVYPRRSQVFGRCPALARRHAGGASTERERARVVAERAGSQGHGRGLEPHLRMTRSEPCCGVQQASPLGERQGDLEVTVGPMSLVGKLRQEEQDSSLALFAGRCLVLIMAGSRGALAAPLPQCRSEHQRDLPGDERAVSPMPGGPGAHRGRRGTGGGPINAYYYQVLVCRTAATNSD